MSTTVEQAVNDSFRTDTVMVEWDANNRVRHLKLKQDDKGYFVRTGKRGANKEYLVSAMWIMDGLYSFKTEYKS